MIGSDCTGSCKSNYHTVTTAPSKFGNFKLAKIHVDHCLVFIVQLYNDFKAK